MEGAVRLFIDCIAYIWFFRIVYEDERAGRYRCGRWISEKGPGWYFNVPFFMDVKPMSIAYGIKFSRRIDVSLSDGRQLSCYLSATARIVDVKLAQLSMDDYDEMMEELLTSVGAERLMDVEADRVTTYEKRGRLVADLRRWAAEEAKEYGVELTRVRFAGLVINAPVLRLLQDQPPPPPKAKDRAA